MPSLKLQSGPAAEPVSVAEAKTHMRVDNPDEDTLIGAYLIAARRWCEAYLKRQFVTATWRMTFDTWPAWTIEVPLPPFQSVTALTYVDTAGATQTLAENTDFITDTRSEPGRITPVHGGVWPDLRDQMNVATLDFVAGYGDATAVPESIKTAIKVLTAHQFENREPIITGTIVAQVPLSVTAFLDAERWGRRVVN